MRCGKNDHFLIELVLGRDLEFAVSILRPSMRCPSLFTEPKPPSLAGCSLSDPVMACFTFARVQASLRRHPWLACRPQSRSLEETCASSWRSGTDNKSRFRFGRRVLTSRCFTKAFTPWTGLDWMGWDWMDFRAGIRFRGLDSWEPRKQFGP